MRAILILLMLCSPAVAQDECMAQDELTAWAALYNQNVVDDFRNEDAYAFLYHFNRMRLDQVFGNRVVILTSSQTAPISIVVVMMRGCVVGRYPVPQSMITSIATVVLSNERTE